MTEFRGFEKFCEGRFFREMPGITARICGICPVSHMLASAKAGDEILAVEIPEAGKRLRRLLHHGQIIQSHALSFFHLSWRRSGFSVHNRVYAHPGNGRDFEALVRYMMRSPVSLSRLRFTTGAKEVVYATKGGHDPSEPGEKERIEADDFVARVLVQIPDPRRHRVRCRVISRILDHIRKRDRVSRPPPHLQPTVAHIA